MRVKEIAVKKLFGVFDHVIPLESPDGVTIIYGPNGYGKTVMLKMIAAAIRGNRDIFEETPFEEFSITLEDGRFGLVRRTIETLDSGKSRVNVDFFTGDGTGRLSQTQFESPQLSPALIRDMDRFVPSPYRVSGSGWTDGNRHLTPRQIIKMFPQAGSLLPPNFWSDEVFFDFCKELSVFFVETNRLTSQTDARTRAPSPYYAPDQSAEREESRVKHYSDDIVHRTRTVLTEYAKSSQERDRTFPERLVGFVRSGGENLSESEILTKLSALEEKRRRLVTLGLLDSERVLSDLTEEDIQKVQEALTIYVGDMEEKLKVFDDMERRVGALIDIVNSRYKYKRVTLTRDQGFKVISDLNQPIDIEDLSSGEQHELIVYYELLFRCPRGGLVLVDEPEISLHAEWQARFLSDLISILKPSDAYAIIATHSPMIIGPRRDLLVELGEPELSRGLVNA